MILIPSLNNAVISNGDFILALTSEEAMIPTVCRVVRAVSIEELNVTWWLSREDVSQRQNLQATSRVHRVLSLATHLI
jgi:hypothetical protein